MGRGAVEGGRPAACAPGGAKCERNGALRAAGTHAAARDGAARHPVPCRSHAAPRLAARPGRPGPTLASVRRNSWYDFSTRPFLRLENAWRIWSEPFGGHGKDWWRREGCGGRGWRVWPTPRGRRGRCGAGQGMLGGGWARAWGHAAGARGCPEGRRARTQPRCAGPLAPSAPRGGRPLLASARVGAPAAAGAPCGAAWRARSRRRGARRHYRTHRHPPPRVRRRERSAACRSRHWAWVREIGDGVEVLGCGLREVKCTASAAADAHCAADGCAGRHGRVKPSSDRLEHHDAPAGARSRRPRSQTATGQTVLSIATARPSRYPWATVDMKPIFSHAAHPARAADGRPRRRPLGPCPRGL